MSDSYNEINREMSNDTANEVGATLRLDPVDLKKLSDTESNNDPVHPIEMEKLDLGEGAVERLSLKPQKKYRFVRGIGRGGMKMVLQVRDLDATRDVAMAVLPEAAARPREDLIRFVQEARLTASLEHPNIVPVHDIGVDASGAPYFTMKLLRGRTLASLIEKLSSGDDPEFAKDYTQHQMLRIFLKISYGVSYAHSKGVIHLDLKPENIQIGDFGEVLIMDWGLAKVIDSPEEKHETGMLTAEADEYKTLDGVMKGTPGYMAPEQAAGMNDRKDKRTDIYALGAILYALMTLQDPLPQTTVKERIDATLAGNIIPPRERAPEREIPAAVEAVIMKAMSLKPDDRYQSVKEIRDEINAFLGGYATVAEKASVVKKTVLFFRRHAILSVILAMLLFLAFAGTSYMIQNRNWNLAGWKCIAAAAFDQEKDDGLYHVTDPENASGRPVRLTDDHTMILNSGEWLWLDRGEQENIALEVRYRAGEPVRPLEIFVRAENKPPASKDALPAGYCFRLGAENGRDWILRIDSDGIAVPLASAPTMLRAGDNTVSVFYHDGQLGIVDAAGKVRLNAEDLILTGGRSTAIRPLNGPSEILDLKISVQPVPDPVSQLFRGSVLAEAGKHRAAYQQYMIAAEAFPDDPDAELALLRAYQLASFQLKDKTLRTAVWKRIQALPAYSRKGRMREIDALYYWNEGRYAEAIRAIDSVLAGHPDGSILKELLTLPHKELPPDVAEALMKRLGRMKNIDWLDISGLGITSLKPLRKLRLNYLNCSRNPLEDLSGMDRTVKFLERP